MTENQRIDHLLLHIMNGDAWHGPALFELLKEVTADEAGKHPIDDTHSIWELVEHITYWQKLVIRRLDNESYEPVDDENWPVITDFSPEKWESTVEELYRTYQVLREKILNFPASKLDYAVSGYHYTYYVLLHGLIHHNLYHAGQIAILKKNLS